MTGEKPCRFRAKFPNARSAAADTFPGWVPYYCPEHDCWHLRLEINTTESDTP